MKRLLSRARVWLLLVAPLLLLVSFPGLQGSAAYAQAGNEPASLENVTVWVNPEYDDPRLLVMIQGKVVGAEIPARVRFLVPAAAEMYSAGSMNFNQYSGGPPDRQPSEIPGWDEISYELTTAIFRVEYYDPIVQNTPEKSFSVELPWRYAVENLKVVVQEPRNSSAFAVNPQGVSGKDGEGFAINSFTYAETAAGESRLFDVSYTRSDTRPSLGTTSSWPEGGVAASADSSNDLAIIFLAVVLIAAVVFFWGVARARKRARGRTQRPAVAYVQTGRSAANGVAQATRRAKKRSAARRRRR